MTLVISAPASKTKDPAMAHTAFAFSRSLRAAAGVLFASVAASAQPSPPPPGAPAPAPTPESAASPGAQPSAATVPKYSAPWALRPAIAPTIVRLDTALAFQDHARAYVPTLLAGYSFLKDAGAYVRGALVYNAPEQGGSGAVIADPIVFGLYTPKIAPELRLALFLGFTAPIGGGGGNSASAESRNNVKAGPYTRSAMDNALFAVNDFVATAGAGLAYIAHGLTLQAEATILELVRVRGGQFQADDKKTNLTAGLHAGYYFGDILSVGAELRYQRWLTTPVAVDKDPAARDALTVAVGPRANFFVANGVVMRPGVSYAHPLDDPMKAAGYKIVQIDIPVVF
jgi:hypothetical protein